MPTAVSHLTDYNWTSVDTDTHLHGLRGVVESSPMLQVSASRGGLSQEKQDVSQRLMSYHHQTGVLLALGKAQQLLSELVPRAYKRKRPQPIQCRKSLRGVPTCSHSSRALL